jgi:hypothetical protein
MRQSAAKETARRLRYEWQALMKVVMPAWSASVVSFVQSYMWKGRYCAPSVSATTPIEAKEIIDVKHHAAHHAEPHVMASVDQAPA